ncbi:MAG: PIG-L deacetylase family protein, partial [Archangium sp.]
DEQPLLLPHFHLSCGTLRTLEGRRLEPSPEALQVLELVDGLRSMAELEVLAGPRVRPALEELEELGVVVRLPPPRAVASERPELVVLSPHFDDAALSVGGILARLSHRMRCDVLNIFSRQSFQSGLRVPPAELDRIALAEDELAARCLGFRTQVLGLSGAQDRHALSLRATLGLTASEVSSNPVFRRDVATVVERLSGWLQGIPLVLAPLGVGGHLDHVVTMLAARQLARRDVIARTALWFYEDLPYAAAPRVRLEDDPAPRAAGAVERLPVDIGPTLDRKRRALKVYRTRLRGSQLELCLTHAQRERADGSPAEWLWRQDAT